MPALILPAFILSVFGVGLGLVFFPRLRLPGKFALVGLGFLTLATGIAFFILWRNL